MTAKTNGVRYNQTRIDLIEALDHGKVREIDRDIRWLNGIGVHDELVVFTDGTAVGADSEATGYCETCEGHELTFHLYTPEATQ